MKAFNKESRESASASLLRDMEVTAAQMRTLIGGMSPHDLLGYIYAQRLMNVITEQDDAKDESKSSSRNELINETQFLLEYVHAILASDSAPSDETFDESQCAQIFELSKQLRGQALLFAMASSVDTKNCIFGPDTDEIEFRAKSTWVVLRGNRYQVLEGEFYGYVLSPHNDVLKEVYGVGAADIAEGFQDMANATRSGQADAMMEMMRQFDAAQLFAAECGKPLEESMEAWVAADEERPNSMRRAMDDMFRGGIANVSRQTELPAALLADLAYKRGEETDFFAAGPFAGTPYRTLPARKKPLIQLGSDYYAVDPCFIRDSGYRALLHNLLQRRPDYKREFEARQKIMSETAFANILSDQLHNATVYHEVYYRDPVSKQWSESDTLILLDDVLFLIEAKAGAAATIASPALDFGRHAQSVQDLALKAYAQCARFFRYISSKDEVSLYKFIGGKYEECGRIQNSNYRVMLPIGLTVESFSPFSTYCKHLPQVEPMLGKHAFISLSIDEIFVLARLLPTSGSFVHYMEVRQSVAGMRGAYLFDEFDHLGAYLTKNRFDQDIADQLRSGKVDMVIWDGMSAVVDESFEGEDWEVRSLPSQDFPEEVAKLLDALDATRSAGWLSADSHIRDLGEQARSNLGKMLSDLRKTLNQSPYRYFVFVGERQPLFIWLQGHDQFDWTTLRNKAGAAALALKASNIINIVAAVTPTGRYDLAQSIPISAPTIRTNENSHVFEDAERMAQPERIVHLNQADNVAASEKSKKVGRNAPCPCGSGMKYKRCHGA